MPTTENELKNIIVRDAKKFTYEGREYNFVPTKIFFMKKTGYRQEGIFFDDNGYFFGKIDIAHTDFLALPDSDIYDNELQEKIRNNNQDRVSPFVAGCFEVNDDGDDE